MHENANIEREKREGIVGFGSRREVLAHAAGFAHPDWIEKMKKDARDYKKLGP